MRFHDAFGGALIFAYVIAQAAAAVEIAWGFLTLPYNMQPLVEMYHDLHKGFKPRLNHLASLIDLDPSELGGMAEELLQNTKVEAADGLLVRFEIAEMITSSKPEDDSFENGPGKTQQSSMRAITESARAITNFAPDERKEGYGGAKKKKPTILSAKEQLELNLFDMGPARTGGSRLHYAAERGTIQMTRATSE